MIERIRARAGRQDGFTLIELIVVIAILGILAAVMTPRVIGAMDSAKKNSAQSTGKQLQVALERYNAEKGLYPAACVVNDVACTDVNDWKAWLTTNLGSYMSLNTADMSAIAYTVAENRKSYTSLVITFTSFAKTVTISSETVAVAD